MMTASYAPETIEYIEELISCSYAEDDCHQFIKEHGETAFRAFYEEYVEYGESYDYDAVDAFIETFSIDDLDNFKDAYYGEFTWDDFVSEYVEENVMHQIPEQFQSYFDYDAYGRDLSYDFIEVNGHIFNRNW